MQAIKQKELRLDSKQIHKTDKINADIHILLNGN
jgi:hypothetical protein